MIKIVENDKYKIAMNTETGLEILTGINGNPDPNVLDYPSLIDIGIMGHCHNTCSFCYQGNKNEPNMELNNYKKIINESKDYVTQVALGGKGDPNQHENFKEIIEYTVANTIVPNYTTSGKDISDEQIEVTKNCGAVAVSMHNKPYTFEALNKFINSGIKTNIHMILSSKSIDDILDLIDGKDIWNNKINLEKLNAVIFLLFKPAGQGEKLSDWIIEEDKLKIFFEKIRNKDMKCNFKIGMDSCLVNKMVKLSGINEKENTFLDTCEGGRMSAYISNDMKLMPCSFRACEHNSGTSIKDKSIIDVWKNESKFKEFRDVLYKDPASCPYEL